MKLTDEQIDKLFQDGASKQSFAYKPEYWEEFSASLSDTPLSEVSDDALDAAFQEEAANQSFEYKPEFWDEFSASLPDNTPLSQASDDALDAAFKNDASNISVDYKPEFWNEFSDELPLMVATENVTDAEVDELYREEASKLSFVYQPAYWEEMAAMLRRRRRRPEFLWFGLSGVFAAAIIAMLFVQQSHVSILTPEFAWNELNPAEQNTNNVASNGTNNSENNAFQNANNNANGSNAEVNPVNNGANPSNLANNGNNPINGNGLNVDPTLAQNNTQANANNTQGAGNNTQVTPRLNRVTPNLVMTATHTEPTRNIASPERTNPESDIVLNPLAAKSLGTLSTFNNDLMEVQELPPLRPYKGGLMTSLYVQGIGGVSQSLITPSDAIGTSYGFGVGIQTHKRNWTFNLGSNIVIENYSDLELTRVAKQYVDFSSNISTQDLQYKNLYSVELDLGIGYNFGRHQVRMGIRPSYTYNARVDYSETKVYNDQGQTIETSENRKGQYGYLEALQLWGLKPTIGYAYNLPSNWSLGLNIGTELRPSINEGFISGVNNRFPLDGQLYIRRTLKIKK